MAPATAFSGRNISEDSLATSTAILAAAYAVCQAVSFPPTAVPSLDGLRVLLNGEAEEWAVEVDEVANTMELPRGVTFCTGSVGGVGVEPAGRFDLRKRGMSKVDDQKSV